MNRKGSDACRVQCICSVCENVIDNDVVSCCICDEKFHAKKDCAGITANILKSISSCDNLSYKCNQCKSVNIGDLLNRFSVIENELKYLREHISTQSYNMINIIHTAMDEYDQRKEKKCNVMVYGLPEPPPSEDNDAQDNDMILELLNELDVNVDDVGTISRVGAIKAGSRRSRPIKLRFRNEDSRRLCLRRAKQLKGSASHHSVFIRPDLTRSQLESNKRLMEEIKARRKAGEDVFLRKGRIVHKQVQ